MKRLLALPVSPLFVSFFVIINFSGAPPAQGTAAAQTQQTRTTQTPAPVQTQGGAEPPPGAAGD